MAVASLVFARTPIALVSFFFFLAHPSLSSFLPLTTSAGEGHQAQRQPEPGRGRRDRAHHAGPVVRQEADRDGAFFREVGKSSRRVGGSPRARDLRPPTPHPSHLYLPLFARPSRTHRSRRSWARACPSAAPWTARIPARSRPRSTRARSTCRRSERNEWGRDCVCHEGMGEGRGESSDAFAPLSPSLFFLVGRGRAIRGTETGRGECGGAVVFRCVAEFFFFRGFLVFCARRSSFFYRPRAPPVPLSPHAFRTHTLTHPLTHTAAGKKCIKKATTHTRTHARALKNWKNLGRERGERPCLRVWRGEEAWGMAEGAAPHPSCSKPRRGLRAYPRVFQPGFCFW